MEEWKRLREKILDRTQEAAGWYELIHSIKDIDLSVAKWIVDISKEMNTKTTLNDKEFLRAKSDATGELMHLFKATERVEGKRMLSKLIIQMIGLLAEPLEESFLLSELIKLLFTQWNVKILHELITTFEDLRPVLVSHLPPLLPLDLDFSLSFLLSLPTSFNSETLLGLVPSPLRSSKVTRKGNFDPEISGEKVLVAQSSLENYRESLGKCWSSVLSCHLSPSQTRQLNKALPQTMLQVLDPLIFSQFYLNQFDNATLSLRALNGLFLLCSQHGLEAKLYYEKLYSLLKEYLRSGNDYNATLFRILGLSLSSKLLSATMLASFIKLLVSHSLLSSSAVVEWALDFTLNTMKKHPKLVKMLKENASDNFSMEEPSPFRTGAVDSGLWELAALRHHYSSAVRTKLQALESPLEHRVVKEYGGQSEEKPQKRPKLLT